MKYLFDALIKTLQLGLGLEFRHEEAAHPCASSALDVHSVSEELLGSLLC